MQATRPRKSIAPTLPDAAPIELTVARYTGIAKDFARDFEDVPLWQCQIRHNARRSILFEVPLAFSDFLSELHATNDNWPSNLQELPSKLNTILRLTRPSAGPQDDPMEVGFVAWRVAFYVAGDATARYNFSQVLDSFLVWRLTHLRGREDSFPDSLELHVYPQLHVDITETLNDFEFPTTRLKDQALILPMLLFDASPSYGKKVIAASIEFPTENTISIAWSGALYNYRERFEAAAVGLSVIESDDQREYVRVLHNQELPEQAAFVTEIFSTRVLHEAACLCTLVDTPPVATAASCMLNALRQLPYIQWRTLL